MSKPLITTLRTRHTSQIAMAHPQIRASSLIRPGGSDFVILVRVHPCNPWLMR